MKKSVIILIGIIYILGIVLVNTFGLQLAEYQSKVYIQRVEFTNDDIFIQNDGEKDIKKVNLRISETKTYQLEWNYTPDNATETKVKFTNDESKGIGTVDENGLVTLHRTGVLIVYVKALEGSSNSDSITIVVK